MTDCAGDSEQDEGVVPRGAGTSLSGGSLPLGDGILLGMGKFNRVLEVDVAAGRHGEGRLPGATEERGHRQGRRERRRHAGSRYQWIARGHAEVIA